MGGVADEKPVRRGPIWVTLALRVVCKLFNCITKRGQMPSDWRQGVLIPNFKRKAVQRLPGCQAIKTVGYFKI